MVTVNSSTNGPDVTTIDRRTDRDAVISKESAVKFGNIYAKAMATSPLTMDSSPEQIRKVIGGRVSPGPERLKRDQAALSASSRMERIWRSFKKLSGR